jgi:DNA-binding IclR family transcriptional regulator
LQEDSSEGTVRALSRGLELLALFTVHNPALTLAELSQRTGLPTTTVRRLAKTMEHHHFLVFDASMGLFHLGPALLQAVRVLESDLELARMVRPWLERLARDTGESTAISTRRDQSVVIIDYVLTSHPFKPEVPSGCLDSFTESWSVHAKVHLAYAGESVIGEVLKARIPRYTERTITDPVVLAQELAKIREEGVAYDLEGRHIGMCALATPVFSRGGKVRAALSVVAPTERFGLEDRDKFATAAKTTAADISRYIEQMHGG